MKSYAYLHLGSMIITIFTTQRGVYNFRSIFQTALAYGPLPRKSRSIRMSMADIFYGSQIRELQTKGIWLFGSLSIDFFEALFLGEIFICFTLLRYTQCSQT